MSLTLNETSLKVMRVLELRSSLTQAVPPTRLVAQMAVFLITVSNTLFALSSPTTGVTVLWCSARSQTQVVEYNAPGNSQLPPIRL